MSPQERPDGRAVIDPSLRPLIDPAATACLGNGWLAVVAVDPQGRAWPWLLAPVEPADDDVADLPHPGRRGCRDVCCARHEQLGPLPAEFRRRVNQCEAIGRTTRCRCRNPAPLGAQFCRVHERGAER